MEFPELVPDEPLSPELVLVLPPELRAQAIAALGDPVWPAPRRRPAPIRALPPAAVAAAPVPLEHTWVRAPLVAEAPTYREPFARTLGAVVGARLLQLGLIFFVVAIVTLAMTLVAQAVR